ncbi:hypothetical protein [Streptomyces decoyicus]|uniref:hypothetical protein n=1 Tax=Streptomyces decoyicus TaxID=249567 RepID=UPI0038143D06
MAAIGLPAAVGVGHTMLSLSGDESWTYVAMDVFAPATLGFAPLALRGVKTTTQTLRATSRAARFGRYTNLRKLIDKNVMRYGLNSERGAKASGALKNLSSDSSTRVHLVTCLRGEVRPDWRTSAMVKF